tara:strand:+ start:891 stop:1667 length:777 start_codon:yes stop_codon:yes gene_type:complete
VQRRRKPKAAPRNVFGSNIPPRPVKKHRDERNKTIAKKSSAASPTPIERVEKITEKVPIKPTIDKEVIEEISVEEAVVEPVVDNIMEIKEEIIEQQILGESPKKRGIGLKKEKVVEVEELVQDLPSSKAMELIEKSRIRATEKSLVKVNMPRKPAPKAVVKRPKPKRHQRNYQPATRLKRLDRSKHMEYKYEMRSLLVKINVAEEYRSNMLASIWAKGERQSTKEAREYIDEKLEEDILDEEQHKSLSRIIDSYTTRR